LHLKSDILGAKFIQSKTQLREAITPSQAVARFFHFMCFFTKMLTTQGNCFHQCLQKRDAVDSVSKLF